MTRRDEALLTSLYELRQASRAQLTRLHFADNKPSTKAVSRRLHRLTVHRYLVAIRCPTLQSTGPPPLVYSVGSFAVQLLARWLDLPLAEVRRRQRQDARLGDRFYQHRAWITDIHIALLLAGRRHGYTLTTWRTDESLSGDNLTIRAKGKVVPLRPDAFFVLARSDNTSRAAFFLELQQTSKPAHYQRKAEAYMAYKTSGEYSKTFGYQSLRVLAVADSEVRAKNLQEAAQRVGGRSLFWSAALVDVLAEPLTTPIWLVAGEVDRLPLFPS